MSELDLLKTDQNGKGKREVAKDKERGGWRELVDKSTLFFFSFVFFFQFFFSFLTAAMCSISDVICSRPWAGARWEGERLTLGWPPSTR